MVGRSKILGGAPEIKMERERPKKIDEPPSKSRTGEGRKTKTLPSREIDDWYSKPRLDRVERKGREIRREEAFCKGAERWGVDGRQKRESPTSYEGNRIRWRRSSLEEHQENGVRSKSAELQIGKFNREPRRA